MSFNNMHRRFSVPFVYVAVSLFLVLCQGCGPVVVEALQPKPRVNMEQQEKTIAFQIDTAVQDTFAVSPGWWDNTNVTGWHSTLESAFDAGIMPHFSQPTDAAPDYTLKIVKTEVFYDNDDSTVTQVSGTSSSISGGKEKISGTAQQTIVHANIVYQAYLLDSSGNELKKDLGTVRKHTQGGRISLLEAAVAEMFEQIATKFFVDEGSADPS